MVRLAKLSGPEDETDCCVNCTEVSNHRVRLVFEFLAIAAVDLNFPFDLHAVNDIAHVLQVFHRPALFVKEGEILCGQ